jgi:Green fluorescent protein
MNNLQDRDCLRDTLLDVNATINSASFRVSGLARGIPNRGEFLASVTAREEVPKGFDLSLLAHVLMTGDSNVALVTEGAINPFVASDGYSATRSIDFGTRGKLTTKFRVAPEEGKNPRKTTFHVTGEVDVPRLVSIEPTIEAWIPDGPGKIDGHFTMVWKTEDGTYLKGEASTQYELLTSECLQGVHYRDIRIDITGIEGVLSQYERIVLFTPKFLGDMLRRNCI